MKRREFIQAAISSTALGGCSLGRYNHSNNISPKVFFDREVPGDRGIQKALSLRESNNVQVDIFNWDHMVGHSHASPVKLPEPMKDAGERSNKRLQWLRKKLKKGIIHDNTD